MAQSSDSTKTGKGERPKKPHPDFPLFAHQTGRWAKKVCGKMEYFGPWNDPQGALEKWIANKDELLAGHRPRPKGNVVTLGDLCNDFLNAKTNRLATGELSQRTFWQYRKVCERIIAHLGKNILVRDMTPEVFDGLRTFLAQGATKGRNVVTLKGDVLVVRMVMKFGLDNGLLERKPIYGQGFDIPDKTALRRSRQAKDQAHGERMFESAELRKIIKAAPQPLRAMILLGINCAFGATDCGALPQNALDLKTGWVKFPRPKTAVERRCPLWPETVKAIKEAIAERPDARNDSDAAAVFLTRYGQRWVRVGSEGSPLDAVANEFTKLLTDLKVKRVRVGFYALRHTFETIGGETGDQVAVNYIMGHADQSMAAAYRERISDDRLRRVADHVRKWLFPVAKKSKSETK